MTTPRSFFLVSALAACALAACASSTGTPVQPETPGTVAVNVQVAPPLTAVSNAFESASSLELPEAAPLEFPALHNVFHLSENIITGSEPGDEASLALIASWGVKTILSTDGKAPDAETAAKYGMRYVHVPIQYKGITEDEQLRIVKVFRELEGPFFVHCFHGKHRGPAGAALGRLALDGVSREQALAEMRQWCGTSSKYSGLYWTVACAELPDEATTRSYRWDFPSAQPLEGIAGAMVTTARHYENVLYSDDVDYGVDPLHPDIDPLNEAEILHQLFAQMRAMDEVQREPDDYREWMADGERASFELVEALRDHRAGVPEARERVEDALAATKQSCAACHTKYRNR
ncbi:hypothetical protein Pla163_16210 [Planctomycetes bacterium Pla163]|uniref:Cytochrome C n=1 Tax=Rohdeia mirabilis TaxID=2528008 RepID=A0A518CZ51_9BACT|nr:hypothetical protein Pla163_16210 [Planctomycetes bacterium Pla163]